MTNTTTENEAAESSKEKSEEIIKDLKDLIYLRVINWKGFDDSTSNFAPLILSLFPNLVISHRDHQLPRVTDDQLLCRAD